MAYFNQISTCLECTEDEHRILDAGFQPGTSRMPVFIISMSEAVISCLMHGAQSSWKATAFVWQVKTLQRLLSAGCGETRLQPELVRTCWRGRMQAHRL